MLICQQPSSSALCVTAEAGVLTLTHCSGVLVYGTQALLPMACSCGMLLYSPEAGALSCWLASGDLSWVARIVYPQPSSSGCPRVALHAEITACGPTLGILAKGAEAGVPTNFFCCVFFMLEV